MTEKKSLVLIDDCEKIEDLDKYGKIFLMCDKNNKREELIKAVKLYNKFKVIEPNGEVYEGTPDDYLVELCGSYHIFTTKNFYNRFQYFQYTKL